MARQIPALVVSGFLGSGKTTLVRRLLLDAQASGLRLAVISNEFGELGIDGALLGRLEEDYVELRGGCVCCKLSDQLVETLAQLRERADPDRVVIETSGVALPYDTQLNFWRDPIRGWIVDDVAVVVVNAEQLAADRELEGTFEQQVSSADLLLLNQIDRVPERSLPALEARLRRIEPEAPILRTRHAELDPRLLFPPGPQPRKRPDPHQADHDHEAFVAEEIAVEPGVAPEALRARLAQLGALRAKGFVETARGSCLVQGVGPRIELEPCRRARPPSCSAASC